MPDNLDPDVKQALCQQLLALADDELILGHRNSEWTGHAPILEEDIAFSNIAQDEIGHALLWYGTYSDLTGVDPDELVFFFRTESGYLNIQMVELPIGDWAFSMLRQYLFDSYELIQLSLMTASNYRPLAEIASKIRQEEIYHHRHTSSWIKRLGLGTDESRNRLQNALDQLWEYAFQLFSPLDGDILLQELGYTPERDTLQEEWRSIVIPQLGDAELTIPAESPALATPRTEHSSHLAELLDEMQEVARSKPRAQW